VASRRSARVPGMETTGTGPLQREGARGDSQSLAIGADPEVIRQFKEVIWGRRCLDSQTIKGEACFSPESIAILASIYSRGRGGRSAKGTKRIGGSQEPTSAICRSAPVTGDPESPDGPSVDQARECLPGFSVAAKKEPGILGCTRQAALDQA